MGKKKPCKPKPKLTSEYVNWLYEVIMVHPRPLVLCQVHVK